METVTIAKQAPKPARYDTKATGPAPDDYAEAGGLADKKERDYVPREGETLADILRRNSALAEAARRMMQGLDATVPGGWPDYRNRVYAAAQLRDTIEGTPIKATAPKVKGDDKQEAGTLKARPRSE